MSKKSEDAGRVYNTLGRYAALPLTILDDPDLSPLAKVAAAHISRGIVWHKNNSDGHMDTTYPELAAKLGVHLTTARRAVQEMIDKGTLSAVARNRGGMRFAFQTKSLNVDWLLYKDWFDGSEVNETADQALARYESTRASEPHAMMERLRADVADWKLKHPKLTAQDYVNAQTVVVKRWQDKQRGYAETFFKRTGKEYEQNDAAYARAIRRLFKQLPPPVAASKSSAGAIAGNKATAVSEAPATIDV